MVGRLGGGACAPSGWALSGTLLVRSAAWYVRPGGGPPARLGAPRHRGARHMAARRALSRSAAAAITSFRAPISSTERRATLTRR